MCARGNLIVGQSGGPTSVINSSLAGVIKACQKTGIKRIYGMRFGIEGFLQENIVDLSEHVTSAHDLSMLKRTPGAFLGTCRYKLPPVEENEEVYEKIFEILEKKNIEYFLYNGGNDSMDTIKQLSDYAATHGKKQRFMGIPKTIDNDLPLTDHCPGYGSAAKFIAATMKEMIHDNESYGASRSTVLIVEIMGRHAGWLTASAVLSKDIDCSGPDLIYLPESPFDPDDCIRRIKELSEKKKSVVVALSEGVKLADGRFLCELGTNNETVDAFGHKQLAGAGAVLAGLVNAKTGLKSRYVEYSTLQRCAAHLASRIDVDEAYNVGFLAAKAAFEGETGKMICIEVKSREPYVVNYDMFDIHEVANVERKVPKAWIINDGTYISKEYVDYVRPLVLGSMEPYTSGGVPIHMNINTKHSFSKGKRQQ